jgi:biotin carboxyl carrier protein
MKFTTYNDLNDAEQSVFLKDSSITINNQEFTFEIDTHRPNIFFIDIDGVRTPVVPSLHSEGYIELSILGYKYPVRAFSEREEYFQKLLKATASATGGATKVQAPMPGLIKKVHVTVGQTVKKGEKLFVLEAMKMENDIKSPIAGVVEKISVEDGAAVEKSALLCTINTEPAS